MRSLEDLAPVPDTDTDAVERIREILFGGQRRDFDNRLAQLASEFETSLDSLRTSIDQRLQRIETSLSAEIAALRQSLAQETRNRDEAHAQLTARADNDKRSTDESITDLHTLSAENREQLEQRLHALDQTLANTTQDAVAHLYDSQDELKERITAVHRELSERLRHDSQRLMEDKVSREDLAGLVAGLAASLAAASGGDDGAN